MMDANTLFSIATELINREADRFGKSMTQAESAQVYRLVYTMLIEDLRSDDDEHDRRLKLERILSCAIRSLEQLRQSKARLVQEGKRYAWFAGTAAMLALAMIFDFYTGRLAMPIAVLGGSGAIYTTIYWGRHAYRRLRLGYSKI